MPTNQEVKEWIKSHNYHMYNQGLKKKLIEHFKQSDICCSYHAGKENTTCNYTIMKCVKIIEEVFEN